jgi:hypothetical protein
MNNITPFIRKIIYIACIGGLLIPLALVSRPETRNEDGEIKDAGGVLSALRDKHNLSQAKMSEIDPASETMKLASLGLRGVAVNMLWMQAMEHKKNEDYDKLASTLQALTKIQPNFVKVWEYQAHNLAYNVSMEFDDYEYRYAWVKKGLAFLKQGIPYNKRDHRVPSKLGFFTGNKFGKSDEKLSFRRMFRKDDEFHREMSDFINPDDYDQVGYGPDSWKMAYHWYDFSRKMVEEQSCPQREGDMLFYMYRPAQLRNQGLSLQDEFRSEEILMEIWRRADEEWQEYGKEEISNTTGLTISMENMAKYESDIDAQRKLLDTMVPEGTRVEMMKDLMQQAELTEEQKAVMDLTPDERTDEQNQLARRITDFLSNMAGNIDRAIAFEAPEEKRTEAEKAVMKIVELQNQILTIDKNSSTVNYRYWRERNGAESNELTISARQALYDAKQMWRQSIYDDEYDYDYKTKTKSVTKQGAISLYLSAFKKWQEVFDTYPELNDGLLADQLKDAIVVYNNMLKVTNREWPDDFPMQKFVDFRYNDGYRDDGLTTTEALEELRTGRSADDKADSSDDEIGAEPMKTEKDDADSEESEIGEPDSEGNKSEDDKSEESDQ